MVETSWKTKTTDSAGSNSDDCDGNAVVENRVLAQEKYDDDAIAQMDAMHDEEKNCDHRERKFAKRNHDRYLFRRVSKAVRCSHI